MKTIAIDFDGVIHKYSKGWQDGTIYDDIVDGAEKFIRDLLTAGNSVVILSTRDPEQIVQWLALEIQGIPILTLSKDQKFWNEKDAIGVTNRKVPAHVYIDDRGMKFEGEFPDVQTIQHFKTWLE